MNKETRMGIMQAQLDHPHMLLVSATPKVIRAVNNFTNGEIRFVDIKMPNVSIEEHFLVMATRALVSKFDIGHIIGNIIILEDLERRTPFNREVSASLSLARAKRDNYSLMKYILNSYIGAKGEFYETPNDQPLRVPRSNVRFDTMHDFSYRSDKYDLPGRDDVKEYILREEMRHRGETTSETFRASNDQRYRDIFVSSVKHILVMSADFDIPTETTYSIITDLVRIYDLDHYNSIKRGTASIEDKLVLICQEYDI